MDDFNVSKDTNKTIQCAHCGFSTGTVLRICDTHLHEKCALMYVARSKLNETRFRVVDNDGMPINVSILFETCRYCQGLELRGTNRLKIHGRLLSHGDDSSKCSNNSDPNYLVYCDRCNCVVSSSAAASTFDIREVGLRKWSCLQCSINKEPNKTNTNVD